MAQQDQQASDYVQMTRESHPDVMAHYERICRNAGIEPLPVYLMGPRKNFGGGLLFQIIFTNQGPPYIEANRDILPLLQARETAVILAHEVAHQREEGLVNDSSTLLNLVIGLAAGVGAARITKATIGKGYDIFSPETELSRREFLESIGKTIAMGGTASGVIYHYGVNSSGPDAIASHHVRVDLRGLQYMEKKEALENIDALISGLKIVVDYENRVYGWEGTSDIPSRIAILNEVRGLLTSPERSVGR